ncbi:hypothetical protein K435DRAFT_804602 [Dendrothele bispora CBS 962.96]|uniref:Uncharacterized protein n=1 Tax=Dendrothele bispora (strain CBS 962.96) TaxID=1314807 RepID=A0A4S8LDV1_DENBC|nr:hypothetical protein K435DRAFT_804602 [Dendrothele bispora CBS 962.96]
MTHLRKWHTCVNGLAPYKNSRDFSHAVNTRLDSGYIPTPQGFNTCPNLKPTNINTSHSGFTNSNLMQLGIMYITKPNMHLCKVLPLFTLDHRMLAAEHMCLKALLFFVSQNIWFNYLESFVTLNTDYPIANLSSSTTQFPSVLPYYNNVWPSPLAAIPPSHVDLWVKWCVQDAPCMGRTILMRKMTYVQNDICMYKWLDILYGMSLNILRFYQIFL